ncbi:MAG: NYN domain-containing protein [Candidatus Daviesbacteria bacterium]|nr:NYN domain-containing protein [Candidatus Daviesbacteria bacterium]
MSSYYYLDDPKSELGYTPVSEEEMHGAILSIAKSHGLNITDKMILDQIQKKESKSKNTKNKTNLYIDGTNLFAGQNELFGPNKHLSFSFLIQEIKKLVPVNHILFYASYMNQKNRIKLTEDRKKLIAAEALFYREVRNTKGVEFYRGHRSPTSGKEKGVDVHLSVDIVKDIFLGNCNQIVIMTGDADLIYPLEIVKMLKIPTHAIFLPNRFSLEMAYKADKAFVLNFSNKFKSDRKLPRQLKVVSIKKPRMVNIRGK